MSFEWQQPSNRIELVADIAENDWSIQVASYIAPGSLIALITPGMVAIAHTTCAITGSDPLYTVTLCRPAVLAFVATRGAYIELIAPPLVSES